MNEEDIDWIRLMCKGRTDSAKILKQSLPQEANFLSIKRGAQPYRDTTTFTRNSKTPYFEVMIDDIKTMNIIRHYKRTYKSLQ